jgi:hypothetical protein
MSSSGPFPEQVCFRLHQETADPYQVVMITLKWRRLPQLSFFCLLWLNIGLALSARVVVGGVVSEY